MNPAMNTDLVAAHDVCGDCPPNMPLLLLVAWVQEQCDEKFDVGFRMGQAPKREVGGFRACDDSDGRR